MANSTVSLAVNGPRKTRMHRLIEEEGIVLMPGIYDALSAAVLQSLGFRAGFISGYAVSASRLGMPDIGLLTPPEMADAARAICAAAPNVAFIVDADTGGGNALNVQRTVRDFMTTGAAGLFLEDQVWPKKTNSTSLPPSRSSTVPWVTFMDIDAGDDFRLAVKDSSLVVEEMDDELFIGGEEAKARTFFIKYTCGDGELHSERGSERPQKDAHAPPHRGGRHRADAGIFDALSAAVLQSLGFRAGFISGYAVSASRLGMPDIGLLTPPEMADAARAICAAAPNVAFIVDADTGGGNALNVQRTVRDLMTTGAAGLFLEDQVWPKKCGHMQGKQVIPAHEHAAKIAAAREAIGDSDFFLIARTDARATAGGLSDAIARANLYMEMRASWSAPRSDDEMREVCKRTNGFRAANMLEGGYTPLHTPQELKELGFHLIVHSTTAVYASARALIDVLKVMKEEGTSRDQLHKLTTFEEFNSLIGLKKLNEIGARYDKFRVPPN
ncbi:carboxyvinyl-carboxyphosphonate phosphorylmutase [Musa troglodytarum]|uniref:Carboxyvinyl-carboxyphosphonate phosphorylmutase n=1 Tax=Musa troglodytarum TaxID=320322 RepID=A0A9E7JUR7_9LILI|nr:carboxyvinyl-carboxyphosphonate phosphorylmutase [Musa troglodytarum]